jgi:hypothetical protein
MIILMILPAGCSNSNEKQTPATGEAVQTKDALPGTVDKVEVYHFHGNHQCASCIAVGQLAEDTVNTYFADELKSGKIVFGHINAELPENRELATAYGVTGSSLWLGTFDENGFHKEENTNVWYKINNKEAYMDYLKLILEKRLAGDLS